MRDIDQLEGAVPIYNWASDLEEGARLQALNLSRLPFAHHHVALMPDAHQGYGMPIGGVLATKGVVIPNAVGVDIGCGMCAVKLSPWLTIRSEHDRKNALGVTRNVVPVGFDKHKEKQPIDLMPIPYADTIVTARQFEAARYQLGTLGGGNHFIEFQSDEDGQTWLMIHSGSRNLGKQVADYYNQLAIKLNAKWHSAVDPKWELAFLPLLSEEGQNYLLEMNYCMEFAKANRLRMASNILAALGIPNVLLDSVINIAHNYARTEFHFGEPVMVHRKGATFANTGVHGIIPGSQGSKSYIVEGVAGPGLRDSFNSCSHGAGRKLGRKAAQRELNLADEIAKLDAQGIVHGIRHTSDLDEAAGAYKDIDVVMANQSDLVRIVRTLTPLAVVKG